jgi:uncharacterized protein (DUF1330 family)
MPTSCGTPAAQRRPVRDEERQDRHGYGAAVRLVFVMVADLRQEDVPAFQQYEAAVLPLLVRHGGRLERRLRSDDAQQEVHIVSFESREGYESYLADEQRQAHRSLLDGSEVVQRLLQVHDV